MYKHHQSASLILQFVNGEKAKVTNVSKGTTEKIIGMEFGVIQKKYYCKEFV